MRRQGLVFRDNLGLAAAAYNAGPKLVFDWLRKGGALPKETRHYVTVVTGHAPERWRKTKHGRLALDVPKRAPCQAVAAVVPAVGLVPAPIEEKKAKAGKKTTKVAGKADRAAIKVKHRALLLKARKSLVVRTVARKAAERLSVKLASGR